MITITTSKAGIIIYHGYHLYLPMTACLCHLNKNFKDFIGQDSMNNSTGGLTIIGIDQNNNIIGCLIHGRHKKLYIRALTGMAEIFRIPLSTVDVDNLVLTKGIGRFLIGFQKILTYWVPEWYMTMIANIIKGQSNK